MYISTGYSCSDKIQCLSVYYLPQNAVLKTTTLPKTTQDIGECLSRQYAHENRECRQCLPILIFLVQQGLPLYGDGDEFKSNYVHVLVLDDFVNLDFDYCHLKILRLLRLLPCDD